MWQEDSLSSSDMMLCPQSQLAKTDSLRGGAATVTDAPTTVCNYMEYKQYHHYHGNWSVTYCIFLPKGLNMERMAKQVIFLKHLHLFNLYLYILNVCKHFKHPLKKGKKSIMLSFLETLAVLLGDNWFAWKLETDWLSQRSLFMRLTVFYIRDKRFRFQLYSILSSVKRSSVPELPVWDLPSSVPELLCSVLCPCSFPLWSPCGTFCPLSLNLLWRTCCPLSLSQDNPTADVNYLFEIHAKTPTAFDAVAIPCVVWSWEGSRIPAGIWGLRQLTFHNILWVCEQEALVYHTHSSGYSVWNTIAALAGKQKQKVEQR